jgi:hypothetical protein
MTTSGLAEPPTMNHVAPAAFDSTYPFERERIRAAAVYCSDGRYGEQVDDFLHNALSLPRYDRLAVPGGPACLARHFKLYREEEGVIEQLRFLIAAHAVERVVLIAHADCAFYLQRLSISALQLETQQRDDMRKAMQRVRGLGTGLRVETYFARARGDRVSFERVQE